jgi:hypothetical protein
VTNLGAVIVIGAGAEMGVNATVPLNSTMA